VLFFIRFSRDISIPFLSLVNNHEAQRPQPIGASDPLADMDTPTVVRFHLNKPAGHWARRSIENNVDRFLLLASWHFYFSRRCNRWHCGDSRH
jgi:hypothetical protein